MIPERDDFWLGGAPSETTASGRVASSSQLAPDAAVDHLRLNRPDPNSAWFTYCRYVEAMEATGRKFDQRLVLEAMFRGSNLVYRAPPPAATADS